jgi:hypothetical protein
MSQQWFFDWDNARGLQLVRRPRRPAAPAHAPYSPNMAPAGYFLFKKAKMGAGMPEPGPGHHQERQGGGRQTSDRRRLQKLGGALQKARSPRRQVRRKILRNKHPPSSNRCHFIHTFAFVCIHTSYTE